MGRVYIALLLVALPVCIQGLRCYSCQSSGDADPTCEKNPAAVANNPIIECNKKYCTIFRQEFVDPKGRVNSFHRGCEEKPIYTNNVITDSNFVSYYRSCTTNLCNSGTGSSSSGGGDSGGGGGGDSGGGWLNPDPGGSNGEGPFLVPGEGGAASMVASVALVMGVSLAVFLGLH